MSSSQSVGSPVTGGGEVPMNQELFGFMSAYDDDDAPDGAWWAMLEDSVTFYNEEHGTTYDPFETVHAYIREKSDD